MHGAPTACPTRHSGAWRGPPFDFGKPETSHCLWLFPLLQGPASSFRLGTATNQPWDIALAWEGPSQPSAYLILTTLR